MAPYMGPVPGQVEKQLSAQMGRHQGDDRLCSACLEGSCFPPLSLGETGTAFAWHSQPLGSNISTGSKSQHSAEGESHILPVRVYAGTSKWFHLCSFFVPLQPQTFAPEQQLPFRRMGP